MTISSPEPNSANETSIILNMVELIRNGNNIAQQPELKVGLVKMWLGRVRVQLRNLYGPESEIVALWPIPDGPMLKEEVGPTLLKRILQLERLISSLSKNGLCALANDGPTRNSVFIGHGRSLVWRELKDFLADRLALPWDEFNRDSVAGIGTSERLVQMLDNANFAFLLMTAEDEHVDATIHARSNVIHEIGLFQGRLGIRKAIVLLEEGCQEFSNIHGLSHIPFSRGRVSTAFEDIRRVLEREHIV